ncbi:DUF6193 family natural product biosynthesis protein [Streptomyces sp. NPDC098077]|uniref:DUF6193 family natural product biosynthesis protein n=1 Tax=Streptomyces sp. NPDC098077 TaxID=3366093 RepID=UPI0037F5A168
MQTALDVRCFSVDCWTGDVLMASGGTPDLTEAAGAMQSWLRAPRVRDFVAQWPFLRTWELAEAHERGDAVAVRWRQLREAVARTAGTALRELVEAAYEQEELRALSPGRGMHWLTFSRRAAPPVCRDLPAAMSLRDGRYRVRRPDGRMQDLDGVAETIAVILADLPEDVARQG